jgi:hypothetical protein
MVTAIRTLSTVETAATGWGASQWASVEKRFAT